MGLSGMPDTVMASENILELSQSMMTTTHISSNSNGFGVCCGHHDNHWVKATLVTLASEIHIVSLGHGKHLLRANMHNKPQWEENTLKN